MASDREAPPLRKPHCKGACEPGGTRDQAVLDVCIARPCWCLEAVASGCSCGLFLDPIRRGIGHHLDTCRIFHQLRGTACSCGKWEAKLGESIMRGFDKHLIAVQMEERDG